MDPFGSIEAQDAALTTLRNAAASRLASSYLFEGPSGIGKELSAIALAKAVIGPDAAARIDAQNHPDVRVFEPREDGKRNIKVDFLRDEILKYAEFAPFEARDAFLIFPQADVSFPAEIPGSANALLKTLEEPRKGVHFILLAERPDRLLPTIRSRCQRVRFRRLPDPVVTSILARHEVPEADRAAAVALADGRADRALTLAQESRATELLDLALRVDDAASKNRPGALLNIAEELAKHADLELALTTLAMYYRDVACVAVGLPANAKFLSAQEELSRSARIGAARATERVAAILEVQESLLANANKQTAMDGLMYRLRSI